MNLLIMKSKEGGKVVYLYRVICVSEISDLHCTLVRRLLGLNVCLNISHFNF